MFSFFKKKTEYTIVAGHMLPTPLMADVKRFDKVYSILPISELNNVLSQAWRVMSKLKWKETFDCNRLAFIFAAEVYKNNRWGSTNLAVALLSYVQDKKTDSRHMIAAIYTDRGWVYIEPATCGIVTLSSKEYGSINFMMF